MTRVHTRAIKSACPANIQKVTLSRPQELTLRKIISDAIISIAFLCFTAGYSYGRINILHEVSSLYNGQGSGKIRTKLEL